MDRKKGLLKESQAGFKEERATKNHIFVLNSLIGNKLKRKGRKLHVPVTFIDFKKAYDLVHIES